MWTGLVSGTLDASPTLEADMAEQDGIRTAAERRRELVERGDDSAERCSRLHFGAGASPRGAQAAEQASDAESPPHGHLMALAVDFLNRNFSPWTFDGSKPVSIELEELLRSVARP